jgi:nucleoid DNA-binding protein
MIKNDIALEIEKKSEFNRAKSLLIVESVLSTLKEALAKSRKGRGLNSDPVRT